MVRLLGGVCGCGGLCTVLRLYRHWVWAVGFCGYGLACDSAGAAAGIPWRWVVAAVRNGGVCEEWKSCAFLPRVTPFCPSHTHCFAAAIRNPYLASRDYQHTHAHSFHSIVTHPHLGHPILTFTHSSRIHAHSILTPRSSPTGTLPARWCTRAVRSHAAASTSSVPRCCTRRQGRPGTAPRGRPAGAGRGHAPSECSFFSKQVVGCCGGAAVDLSGLVSCGLCGVVHLCDGQRCRALRSLKTTAYAVLV